MKDYLPNRCQTVIVRSTRSTSMPITAGVPQGSVLGPLLFLVYVNDISNNLISISRLFPDDTSLACSSTSIIELELILKLDIQMTYGPI